VTRHRFSKMHGAANDYVYVLGLDGRPLPDGAKIAPAISDRRRGIGSDGLVYILPSARAHARMRMWNADGSEAEMCGNAIRCVAKLLLDDGHLSGASLTIETLAGIKTVVPLPGRDGKVERVRVDMGPPSFARKDVGLAGEGDAVDVEVGGVRGTGVSMGNPHFVLLDEDLSDARFLAIGPALEGHPAFARRANIELVHVESRDRLVVRVYERGSGETLACGTGACAVHVAARRAGRVGDRSTVALRGGDLEIEWPGSGSVFMTGPAVRVFDGEVEL
jgi:diaminopimelate epimerase